MATVRIYYSREDQDYDNWNLFYFPGTFKDDTHENLLPDDTIDFIFPYGPRKKLDFTSEGSFGYVDVELNTAKQFSFYIRRKDFVFDYNGEYCEPLKMENSPLCEYCYEVGYVWDINTNVAPYTEFYVKNDSPYVFTDSNWNMLCPMDITMTGATVFDKDEDPLAVDDGDDGTDQGSFEKFKIFYSKGEALLLDIPAEAEFPMAGEFAERDIREYLVLYLLGKSYTIGEDMDINISAEALASEKADALQMCEKAIANCLFKLGEDIDAFDEVAFLADVDGYKEGFSLSFGPTIDYLEEQLNIQATLTA